MTDLSNNSSAKSVAHSDPNRLKIRVSENSISFLASSGEGNYEHRPYVVKSGMSMAANLRTAFRQEEWLQEKGNKAVLCVTTPVALVPVDEYMDEENFNADLFYSSTFPGYEGYEKIVNVLPELNCVAVFAVNSDLKMVVNDNFTDVRYRNVMQPVWRHIYRNNKIEGQHRKLFAYFHDGRVDVFAFQSHRFRFANSYDAKFSHDSLYFILFVWKQLSFDNENDELHIIGSTEYTEWLLGKLRTFLRRVYLVNPVAELNRAPASLIEDLEFDMMI